MWAISPTAVRRYGRARSAFGTGPGTSTSAVAPLFFGDGSGAGLTASQLMQVIFYSDASVTILPYAPGYSGFTGGFGEVVPVPEPSSVFAGLALCGLAGWREWRKSKARR